MRPTVNGVRTVLEIHRLLPIPAEMYTIVLKAVKYWAVRRGVTGNLFGFPNGVAWAVLVLRACQSNPVPHPVALFRQFFWYYGKTLFDQDHIEPVFVTESLDPPAEVMRLPAYKHIQQDKSKAFRLYGLQESWSPQRLLYADDLFPVINPAYPYVNACHNVGRCGVELLYKEITRAYFILQGNTDALELESLWRPYIIAEDFEQFLVVDVVSALNPTSTGAGAFEVWSAYVGSRMRMLIYALETMYDIRPFPKQLQHASTPAPYGCRFAIGIRRKPAGANAASHEGVSTRDDGDDNSHSISWKSVASLFEEFRCSVALGRARILEQSPFIDESDILDPTYSILTRDDPSFPPELRKPLV